MKLSITASTAWREMRANKLRTALMVAGIVIGIAVLTVIFAIGEGAQARVSQSLERMGTEDLIIVMSRDRGGIPGGGGGGGMPGGGQEQQGQKQGEGGISGGSSGIQQESTLTARDVEAIRQINGINLVSPVFTERDSEINFGSQAHTTVLYGVEPGWEQLNNWVLQSGSFFTGYEVDAAERVVVLGQTVANILFGAGVDPIGESIRIRNTVFEVTGVFEPKGAGSMGRDADDIAVIPFATFSRLLNRSTYDQILLQPANMGNVNRVAEEVTAVLREEHRLGPQDEVNFGVRIPVELMQLRQGLSDTMKIFLAIAALIALVVGGVVIMNIMLVSVGERTKEIGLRKAVGAREKDILTQFMIEAVTVSLLGGLIGVFAGLIGSWFVRVFAQMPTAVSWKVILVAAFFSVLVGIIFGLQPAKKAASLDPVKALRSE